MFRKKRNLVIIKLKQGMYNRVKEIIQILQIEHLLLDQNYLLINRWDLVKLLSIYDTFEFIIEI